MSRKVISLTRKCCILINEIIGGYSLAFLPDSYLKEAHLMPKRTDIHSILIIGAGPIVIGQACEFDYCHHNDRPRNGRCHLYRTYYS